MIAYLLKSILSLLLLFGFYKFWLENERLHQFKRFYLLGSLIFSALVPLISLPGWPVAVPLTDFLPVPFVERGIGTTLPQTEVPPVRDDADSSIWWWVYGAITALMLTRFAANLYTLARQIDSHPNQPFRGATLVRLRESGSPYTFLHYLFVPDDAYQRGEIEGELFTHELTHIRQRHSLDVLLIELLLCFGWFNPLLVWVKRAIQLNHEFLADGVVNSTYQNVRHYQLLLLAKLAPTPAVRLTSTLTFQTTKQRLLMMTKHTSRAIAWLAGGSTAILFGILTAAFSTTSSAQVVPTPSGSTPAVTNQPQPETDVAKMDRLYGDKLVRTWPGGSKQVWRKFSELSMAEKKTVRLIPPQARKTPTEAQFEEWKNPKKFGVWVDGKRDRNFTKTPYQSTDIASFWGSFVHKNARQPEGYLYQMDLMTEPYYAAYLKEKAKSPMLVIWNRPPAKQ